MAKQIPDYLKLLKVEDAPPPPGQRDEPSSIDILCSAFERATGWRLRYETGLAAEERDAGPGLVLSPAPRADDERFARVPRQEVEQLAGAIALVLGELDRTRLALLSREAELAAGVPVTPREDEETHLATRLESTLAAGIEAVGGTAAALYLLDEGTSELKLRAMVGLPASRLLAPPRPLRGAIADLEALLGHAVVIEDTALLPHWRCPEDFPSATCVPVSSPSTPLGTLWIFSDTPRDFTPAQTNMIEVVAGRIAADLEREMLLTAGERTQTLSRGLHEAARWQEEHLPSVAPLIDDWDVAGATQCGGELSGEFFDWSVLADGHLAVALGDAHGRAVTAGLSAAALQAALKSHAIYSHDAAKMLERVNETLWTSSPGGQYGSLFYGLIAPERGELEFASAGRLGALVVHPDGHIVLSRGSPPLGSDPDLRALARAHALPPGGALVVVSDGLLATLDAYERPWDELSIAEFLRRQLYLSASELAARLQSALGPVQSVDRTLLIVKRVR